MKNWNLLGNSVLLNISEYLQQCNKIIEKFNSELSVLHSRDSILSISDLLLQLLTSANPNSTEYKILNWIENQKILTKYQILLSSVNSKIQV